MTPLDDLFSTDESRAESQLEKVMTLNPAEISDFPNHPFKVKQDDDMAEMVESIKKYGVLVPALVRPKEDGGYEMVAGHRRKFAAVLAGIAEIPCIVRSLTDDEATIVMVDSNLQREKILPSEKAFAYKMKLDAMKRQAGRPSKENSVPVGQNFEGKTSRELLAAKSPDSNTQIQRYIRLTELIPSVLQMVDDGKIAFRPAVELSYLSKDGISVSTRYGEVENVEFNSDGALGITVYHQNRKGSASSTDLSPQAIARTVQAALDIARYTSPDPCAGVADKELLAFDAPDLDLFHPAEVSPDEAIELAARAEQAALQADKRITNTEGGSFNSHYGVKVFGNSHGMLQGYCSTRHSLSSCVIAEENGDMERDYAYTIGRAMSDLQTPEWVGADCARRTLSRLSPRKLSTMKAPVIFANEVATGLFGHLVGAIAGGSVYRKSTFLLDSLGKQILPDWLTIEEHPHLLKGLASTPFDSEGVRTERRDIIKDGILTQWLLTSYSARKLGLKSTGHAGGIHNWRIAGQGLSFEQMLKEMGTGLVVTELMGQGVSAITGDYSRGAAGFWVENGEIQYPVSEITIAGNLKDMWRNIVTVGNDIETRSNIQCGSVLLPEMKIAGQ